MFTRRKIVQDALQAKSQLIDQQCVVYNSGVTSVMLVMLDTPVAICSQALMDIEARPRQKHCDNKQQAGFRVTFAIVIMF